MNNSNALSNKHSQRRSSFARSLAISAVVALCGAAGSMAVQAQSTAGTVFGVAPSGDSILVHSDVNGLQRRVHADSKGRYKVKMVPAGIYTVTLEENGQAIVKHPNVTVLAGGGVKVDFDCAKGECGKPADKS